MHSDLCMGAGGIVEEGGWNALNMCKQAEREEMGNTEAITSKEMLVVCVFKHLQERK